MGEPRGDLVQSLLAENRALKVEAERHRLEAAELRARVGRPDPRLGRLEAENQRLRVELASARSERDALKEGIGSALERIRRGA